jgi:hypothetical protein
LQTIALQYTKSRIRTSTGDSQCSYQHCPDNTIHGQGQGSYASPAIWLLRSCFLIRKHIWMEMKDVEDCRNTLIQLIGAFVDDISIFTNDE